MGIKDIDITGIIIMTGDKKPPGHTAAAFRSRETAVLKKTAEPAGI